MDYENVVSAHKAFEQQLDGSICPFVAAPSVECHCLNITSSKIKSVIYYCGANFKKCEIYHNNNTVLKENSSLL